MTSPGVSGTPRSDAPARPAGGLALRVRYPDGDTAVVHAAGEIDERALARFRDVLHQRLTAAVAVVVVDLSAVSFLSLGGVQALSAAALLADAREVSLRLVVTDHAVRRALRAAGVDEQLECHADLPGALRAAARPQPELG